MTFKKKDIIYLPECHSTNEYMQSLVRNDKFPEGLIVVTDFQTTGKGQRGSYWESEPASNLLFSMLLRPGFLQANRAFFLTMVSALSLLSSLHGRIGILPQIKWPNDIYVKGKKISGILSESAISGKSLEYVIVGIGLNVNQSHFETKNATSMKLLVGKNFDREALLDTWRSDFEGYYEKLKKGHFEEIRTEYHDHLLGLNERQTFVSEGVQWQGTITAVTDQGLLQVRTDAGTRKYGMKEISFVP